MSLLYNVVGTVARTLLVSESCTELFRVMYINNNKWYFTSKSNEIIIKSCVADLLETAKC